MKKQILTLLALILLTAASPTPDVQIINQTELQPTPSGIQNEQFLEKTIKISSNISFPLRIDVTAKGNGMLTIANLRLQIYDDHDDGSYYENSMLTTVFTDIDGDGCLDLVIRGRILYTDEKGNDIIKTQDVAFLYLFDKSSKQFTRVYHTEGVSIDVDPPRQQ